MTSEILVLVAIAMAIVPIMAIWTLCRLATRNGRLELYSWYHGEYVDMGGDYLFKFDFFGNPISARMSPKTIQEALSKIQVPHK